MNEVVEIKELLDRYYEGASTDADEQRLHEYFTSDHLDTELQPYHAIFACLKNEKETYRIGVRQETHSLPSKLQISRWWYAAAAVVCLLAGTYIAREWKTAPENLCVGTYVMVNGICYDDMTLVRKYAVETIDCITKPCSEGSAIDALDFLIFE